MGIDTESPPAPIPQQVGAAPRGLSLLDAGLATAGLVVILSWAVVSASHLRDRYQVNFVSGVYTALAFRLNQGDFYPSLYGGAHYGGTRYMPLPFVLSLLSRKHPELTAPLVRRLRNGEFSKVVLLRRLDTASSRDWHVWYERHLGKPVANAIVERYQLAGQVEEFFIYVPRPGP